MLSECLLNKRKGLINVRSICLWTRDDRQWLFAFQFPPIPIQSIPIPIPEQWLWHKQFWPIEDCALIVVESKTDHDSQNHALLHYWLPQTKENMPNGTLLWLTVIFYAEQNCHQNQSPMGIDSHGNKGHSHAGCFPFLFPILSSIPIPTGNLIPMVVCTLNVRKYL